MTGRRLAAAGALVFLFAALALALVVVIQEFPQGLVVARPGVRCGAWPAGTESCGAARPESPASRWAAVALAAAILLVVDERAIEVALIVGGVVAAGACARAAVSQRTQLASATAPEHPVLIFNPKSGGGKAERFSLADEARARGIEAIELTLGQDLETIARDAVARGADGLAMAGGDGSQAIVAAIAAELDLPYACIPSGTRNHFALDLGVDRDDVVGALDAFVAGGERRVDLAEVNGRVFVNNVSLGLYAEAVQREGYRDAKIRTLLDTVPDALGPSGPGLDLRWTGPDGHEHHSGRHDPGLEQPLPARARGRLRNPARRSTTACSGSRSPGRRRAVERAGGCRSDRCGQWSAPTFEVDADGPFRPGSTARRSSSSPPSLHASARASCACESRRSIPVPRRRRSCPRASATACARSRGSHSNRQQKET